MQRSVFVLALAFAGTSPVQPAPKEKDYCELAAEDRAEIRMYERDEAFEFLMEPAKKKLAENAKRCGRVMTEPKIGMLYQDVIRSTTWGKPDSMRKTETAGGVSYQLIYGEGRYLYIRNGQVTAIQDQR